MIWTNCHTPAVPSKAMGLGWNPWAVLRTRAHIELAWASLSVGRGRIEQTSDGRRRIILDPALGRRQRSVVLGHELVHDELDLLWPPGSPPGLVAKGERLVDRINAERTIPLGALRAYIDRLVDLGEAVTSPMVAEQFDTTEELAELAMRLIE